MSRMLLAWPEDDGATWHWLAPGGAPQAGDQAALARAAAGSAVGVLLPAATVGLTRATIPARSAHQAVQAAPYAIEEQVIGEVEDLAIALAPADAAGDYAIAYVERARLDAWLAPLHAAGIELAWATSAVLALPQPAQDAWTVLAEDERLIVRNGPCAGFGGEVELLGEVLAALPADARPARITLRCAAGTAPPTVPREIALDIQRETRSWLAVLAAHAPPRPPLDLLPARYTRRGADAARRWYGAAAGIALLALAGHLGATAWSVERMDARLAALDTRQRAVLQHAFPDITRVVNPLAQARRALAARESNAGPGGNFLDALAAVARSQSAQGADGLAFSALSFADGVLNLTVEAPAVAGVERFGEQLGDSAFVAEILSAESGADGVTSRVRVTPR
ncbi:MAG: type II secretion system protein GspL [Gammaproteobacteria bacterium]